MAINTAITSQDTPATSGDIVVADGSSIQLWTAPALGNEESVTLFRTDGGSVEEEVREDNNAVALSPKRPSLSLNGPGTFRVKKTATAAATAVYYDS